MRLILDASVLLAAAGSANGASRAVFTYASGQNWSLITSPYVLDEALRNLDKLSARATADRLVLRSQLAVVDNVVSRDRAVIVAASKARPILFTALAWSTELLTLNRADFVDILGGRF